MKFGTDNKELLENINYFFGEQHESIEEISYNDLMWYLENLFSDNKRLNEYYRNKESKK